MKAKRLKYIGIIVILICLAVVFLKLNKNSNNGFTAKTNSKEITIERNIRIPEGKTRKFTFPKELIEISMTSFETIDDVIQDIEGENQNGSCEKIQNNGNGTISLWITDLQLESWIAGIEDALNHYVKESEQQGVKIKINSAMNDITYRITKENEMSLKAWGMFVVNFESMLLEAQVFKGVPSEETQIHMKVIQERTGDVLVDVTLPGDGYEITEAQWKGKNKDLEIDHSE